MVISVSAGPCRGVPDTTRAVRRTPKPWFLRTIVPVRPFELRSAPMADRYSLRMRFQAAAITILLLLSSIGAPAWGQTDEEIAGARAAAQEGLKAFRERRWSDSVDL